MTMAMGVVAGVACSLILAGLMVATRLVEGFRFWPPGEYDYRWWAYTVLSAVPSVDLAMLALWGARNFVFDGPIWFWSATVLAVVGIAGFTVATLDLGVETSVGMEGEFHTDGYYRFSRNPQLVFLILATTGVAVVANNSNACLIGASMNAWFVSMPFAEEPWLRERFGQEYEVYLEQTPRFVGLVSMKRLIEVLTERTGT